MGFTNDELYEIETRFDYSAAAHVRGAAELCGQLDKLGQKLLKKLLPEMIETYDTYRTISAKARTMRKNTEAIK